MKRPNYEVDYRLDPLGKGLYAYLDEERKAWYYIPESDLSKKELRIRTKLLWQRKKWGRKHQSFVEWLRENRKKGIDNF